MFFGSHSILKNQNKLFFLIESMNQRNDIEWQERKRIWVEWEMNERLKDMVFLFHHVLLLFEKLQIYYWTNGITMTSSYTIIFHVLPQSSLWVIFILCMCIQNRENYEGWGLEKILEEKEKLQKKNENNFSKARYKKWKCIQKFQLDKNHFSYFTKICS